MKTYKVNFKYKGNINVIEYKANSKEHALSIAMIKLGHTITDLNQVELLSCVEK